MSHHFFFTLIFTRLGLLGVFIKQLSHRVPLPGGQKCWFDETEGEECDIASSDAIGIGYC
jgi:hypothetical protein